MSSLWIRSQDRTTLIRSYEIYVSEQCNHYLIRAKRTSHILGSYKTFERTLKVLNEIQNRINEIANIDDANYIKAVYEMPKE